MSLVRVDFEELYRRHLRRHSQLGINVLHLVSVVGVYLSLFAIAMAFPGGRWIVGGVLAVYFGLLAMNLSLPLLLADMIFVGLVGGLYFALPPINVWIYVALIPAWHRFQVWNHKVYHRSFDMTEFAGKYKKGLKLFLLLSLYEAPILLQYLVFDRRKEEAVIGEMTTEAPSA